jgi:hypothetical protein
VNNTELKCYDWLTAIYKAKAEFNPIRHLLLIADKTYIARTLQTDRITFTGNEVASLQDSKIDAIVAVFSIQDKPVSIFPFNEIDFVRHTTPSDKIRAYVTGMETASSIRLTTSQYEELNTVKELVQNDFGKNYSFGDVIHILCLGYSTGRAVIMRESQPVMVNQTQDEEKALNHDQIS